MTTQKLIHALLNLSEIEALSSQSHWLTRLHPLGKLLVTVFYIFMVTASPKYSLQTVILLASYPVFIMAATPIPARTLLSKLIIPAFFSISLGLFNPILDPAYGWLSLLTLMIKALLCGFAALLLVATTKVEDIAYALGWLRFPKLMTTLFLLMFRYIVLFINEIERVITAYSLRSGGHTALKPSAWGPLIGQLIIRTADKAERLHDAMLLRGFHGHYHTSQPARLNATDTLYLTLWPVVFIAIRLITT